MPESLDTFFPPHCFLAPRVWDGVSRWFPNEPHTIEFATGHSLSCAGKMPIICHRGTLSPDGLAAMAEAGINVAAERLGYVEPEEYRDHVRSLARQALKAITPFWTPPDIVPSEATWIDPSLLQFLNNKLNMPALVPAGSLPARRVLPRDSTAAIREITLPAVIKVGTDLPNGGGDDIVICHRRRHRERAAKHFSTEEGLILEELLEIVENYCVQFAVLPDTGVIYVGTSSQICMPNGVHAGNIIDPSDPPADKVLELGEQIARTGAGMGFSGIAGFDIVVTKDGRVLAIDLNFRLVSSTGQVLLHPRLSRERGLPVSRLAFCSFRGPLPEMMRICRPFIRDGWLAPLATFDPEYGQLSPGPARGRFLLFGESAKAITKREGMLSALGITVAGRKSDRGFTSGVKNWLGSFLARQPH